MGMEKFTGYPSIDKTWLKYYTEEQIHAELPKCKIYDYIWEQNRQYLTNPALHYYGRNITYGQMFEGIEKAAKAFRAIGVKKGDIVAVIAVTLPETIYTFYGLNRIGAIANMIDPRTSIEGIKNYIEEVNAKVIVLLDAVYEKVNAAVQGTTIEKMVILSPADSLPFVKKQLYRLTKRVRIQEDKKCKTWKTFMQKQPVKKNNVVRVIGLNELEGLSPDNRIHYINNLRKLCKERQVLKETNSMSVKTIGEMVSRLRPYGLEIEDVLLIWI